MLEGLIVGAITGLMVTLLRWLFSLFRKKPKVEDVTEGGPAIYTPPAPQPEPQPVSQPPVSQPEIPRQPAYQPPVYTPQEDTAGSTTPLNPTWVQPAPAELCLVGVRGPLEGQCFPLTREGVAIGRNPSRCQICFPMETPGVSGIHCKVVLQMRTTGGIDYLPELTDLGSSYGTFLHRTDPNTYGSSPIKLEPSIPCEIHPGSIFSLGNPNGPAFRLEQKGE